MKNPYQIVGSYDGENYVSRDADKHLMRFIEDNTSYPYFCASRQSGKSSLIGHTINLLPKSIFLCVSIDLSVLQLNSVEGLFSEILNIIADRLSLDRAVIDIYGSTLYENVFHQWLSVLPYRLNIFIDELDVLMRANHQIQKDFSIRFLAKIRSLFNKRIESKYESTLSRLQFVLSGAVDPIQLAPDRWCSPFNVGDRVELLDFTITHIRKICKPLAAKGMLAENLAELIYEQTNGVVYLTNLILYTLWDDIETGQMIGRDEVNKVVKNICISAVSNAHFINIYQIIRNDLNTYRIFCNHLNNDRLDVDAQTELLLTGLCTSRKAFRCKMYKKIFGERKSLLCLVPASKSNFNRRLHGSFNYRHIVYSAIVIAGMGASFFIVLFGQNTFKRIQTSKLIDAAIPVDIPMDQALLSFSAPPHDLDIVRPTPRADGGFSMSPAKLPLVEQYIFRYEPAISLANRAKLELCLRSFSGAFDIELLMLNGKYRVSSPSGSAMQKSNLLRSCLDVHFEKGDLPDPLQIQKEKRGR